MITNLAYIVFDEETKRMKIGSIHPGVDLEEIQNSTGFELVIPEKLIETKPPTKEEIKILREKVDPLNIRKLEVLGGNKRADLLEDIIEKEIAKKNKFPDLLR